MATVLRDAGLSSLIPSDAELRTVAEGLQFTEGPLELGDGSLLFQDIKAERTYRLAADGSLTVLRESTGAANGQTFDRSGRIVFCEQNGRRVSRMNADGTDVETLVENWDGARLNSPNDIVARSDGRLYFTDPPYGAPPDRPLDFQGVYRIDPDDSLHLLLNDFEKPNGLAFAPDETTLYVCDTARYHVRAFDIAADGSVDPVSGRNLATMDPGTSGGPDGIKVDGNGRLWIAVALGLWVFDPDGRLLGILATPKRPANLAWCGPDADTLAITAVDEVHKIRVGVRGLRPPFAR